MSQKTFDFAPTVVDVEAIRESVTDRSSVTLRPYQAAASDWAIEQLYDIGHSSALVVLPTGTGKSVVFSEVMRRASSMSGGRMLLLAHRRELLKQAIGHSAAAGLHGDLEMAANQAVGCDVVCASVQTLLAKRRCDVCRGTGRSGDDECSQCDGRGKFLRMEKFDPSEFSLMVTDEAHHATARTYRAVYEWFGRNETIKHLGVTATPERGDNVGLGNVYDVAWNELPLPVAISDGWLVPLRQMFVKCDRLILEGVRTKAGDYVDADIERAFLGGGSDDDKATILHQVAFPIAEECKGGKSFILFCAGVDHAHELARELASYPHLENRVELLTGKTSDEDRESIMARLKSGESCGLVNVGVATEGFDLPTLDICAIARPTRSKGLYLQMIGRVTRPLKGVVDGPVDVLGRLSAIANSSKPYATVMDFVGASRLLKGQQSVASVLAGDDVDEQDVLAAINHAIRMGTSIDMQALTEEQRQERLKKLEEAARKRREAEERRREDRRVEASGRYAVDGEYDREFVSMFNPLFDVDADYTPAPDGATPKQVKYLISLGVSPENACGMTRRQAGAVIDKLTAASGGDYVMRFGKHKGRKLKDVPSGWIAWAERELRHNRELLANIREMRGVGGQHSVSTVDDAPF